MSATARSTACAPGPGQAWSIRGFTCLSSSERHGFRWGAGKSPLAGAHRGDHGL